MPYWILFIDERGETGSTDRFGVPSLHLSSVTHPEEGDRDTAMLAALQEAEIDVVVLAGYLKKVGPRVLNAYAGRMINTHPALLPAYGSTGMYGDRVHAAVLRDQPAESGATIHLVTENYDEGPILVQTRVPVLPGDDIASLRDRVQYAEKNQLVRW
ncbi:formyltransferase family protein [Nesterenkonia muleiensis]|uniref:formyltransferase family protein n=1 Tax=Nesterenkonia muleiensis TaxID=2282648 RepID=UPI000E743463|nr:formyltransferase family protein [Nesterenkonia muleiensis]